MQRVKLTSAVKSDDPFIVMGDAGDTLTLITPAAEWVVRQGNGEFVGGEIDKPGPSRAELEAAEAQHGTLKPLGDDDKVVEPEDDDKVVEPPKKPYGNAPKSAWARYAADVDPEMTLERAEDMTKADLMSKYGSRLGDED
jgi:hypothetical protein